MPLDFSRPIQTRDGRKVRILCTDRNAHYPIVGIIIESPEQRVETWLPDGRRWVSGTSNGDLINPKVKKWKWAYERSGSSFVLRNHLSEDEMQGFIRRDPTVTVIGRIYETEIEE